MSAFGKIIAKVLNLVFEDILMPVLISFLKFAWNLIADLIKDAFGWILYMGFTLILQVVKFENEAFEFFAGTSQGLVYMGGESMTLLEALFKLNQVQVLFAAATAVGIAVAIIASTIQTVKSVSDMTLENKNPISHVLQNSFKAAVTFAIIPILCIFLLKLSTVVLDSIDEVVAEATGRGNISIDRLMWLNFSMNASTDPNWNADTAPAENVNLIGTEADPYRWPYVNDEHTSYAYMDIISSSTNQNKFEAAFKYGEFDNITGAIVGIVVMFIFAGVLFGFIKRIFELVILYIVGPVFAATIPLDEGEKFKRWKDQFLGTFFVGFGPIISMRVFVLISPLICGGQIDFMPGCPEENIVMQMLFLVGGAYAIYKGTGMFMEILNPATAGREAQNQGGGMMALSLAKNAALTVGGGMLGGMIGGIKGDKKNDKEQQDKKDQDEKESKDGGANIPPKPESPSESKGGE